MAILQGASDRPTFKEGNADPARSVRSAELDRARSVEALVHTRKLLDRTRAYVRDFSHELQHSMQAGRR